jgi:hypothetical protein
MREKRLSYSGKKERVQHIANKLRNKVIVAGIASFAVLGCGDSDKNTSPPSLGEAGETGATTGGTTSSSGSGGSANAAGTTSAGAGGAQAESLCDMYPEGHENRQEYRLGQGEGPECSDYVLMFYEIRDDGVARFTYMNGMNPLSTDFVGFRVGTQYTRDFPEVGRTTFELCEKTSAACEFQWGSDPIGDPNCRATLAADRSFACQ